MEGGGGGALNGGLGADLAPEPMGVEAGPGVSVDNWIYTSPSRFLKQQ